MPRYPNIWIDLETGTWGSTDELLILCLREEQIAELEQMSDATIKEYWEGSIPYFNRDV